MGRGADYLPHRSTSSSRSRALPSRVRAARRASPSRLLGARAISRAGVGGRCRRGPRDRIVGDIWPLLSPRRFLPDGTARPTPVPSWGDPARVRRRGQTAAAGRPGTQDTMLVARGRRPPVPAGQRHHDESREGERGLVVSRGRHSGRGLGVVPCARQREVREDAGNDGGVVDGGDRFHPAGAEPGRDSALAVGDDERVAAPCDDSVTSTRNSNSLFACRWLRARDLNPRLGSTRAQAG
jgi:hypothetical protein